MAEYARTWSWDHDGPKVKGTVHRLDFIENGKYGPTHVMEIMDPDNGHIAIWFGTAGLKKILEYDKPQRGDMIEIEFQGWEDIIDYKTGLPKAHPERPDEPFRRRLFAGGVIRPSDDNPFASAAAVPTPEPVNDDDIPF
jgi:hypothetical protein